MGNRGLGRLQLGAAEARAVYEARLQQLWQELDCAAEYQLECRHRLKIYSPGTLNSGAGPDFLNARIEIDGQTLVGDVEIHRQTSGWFRHHHQLDARYRDVVLHVVEENDLPSDAALPPVLTFDQLKQVPGNQARWRHRCHLFFRTLDDESIVRMLTAAAMERFDRKTEKILHHSLSHGLYRAMIAAWADALGYRNNRAAFAELVIRFMAHSEDDRRDHAAALLWGESGLLPDPAAVKLPAAMAAWVKRLWCEWSALRQEDRPPLPWVRHGNRPYNSPERRVAALAALLTRPRPELPSGNFSPAELGRQLLEQTMASDPLWDHYTSFTSKTARPAAILGRDRALELVTNVTLPAWSAEAMMAKPKASLATRSGLIRDAWLTLPPPADNQIIRRVKKMWFPDRDTTAIFNTAAARQGAIQLYREFCESCQSDCLSCRFYNSL